MTKDEVMLELAVFGNEQTKKVLTRHGAREPFYGVKIGDLKTPVKKIKKELDHIPGHIHRSQNRVRFAMNGFVIAVGSYVPTLTEKAREVAETIGKVSVDMGGTACKVPLAAAVIKKTEDKGNIGKRRKSARC